MLLRRGFLLAAIIYFFNSVGNIAQGVFIKYYQQDLQIDLYEFVALRGFVEAVLLFPFAWKYIKNFYKNLSVVIVLAVFYSLDMLLFNSGLKSVAINTGALIMLLTPLWIVVIGRLMLKEKKFNKLNALMLGFCIFGVFLTIFSEVKFSGFNFGYVLLFSDSIIVALGLLLQKKFYDCRPVAYALFSNAVILSALSFFISGFSLPEISFKNIQGAFVVALFDIMEFACVYIAYQMTEASLLQPIRFTRIIIAIVLSSCILHENVSSYQIIGACIVLIANIASIIYSKKKQDH